jgi:hypothetical protein
MEKVVRSVICDLCRADRPAVVQLTIDVCGKHQQQIAGRHTDVASEHSLNGHRDQDNEALLEAIRSEPGMKRAHYAEVLHWDPLRVSHAVNRLKKRRQVRIRGKAHASSYSPVGGR